MSNLLINQGTVIEIMETGEPDLVQWRYRNTEDWTKDLASYAGLLHRGWVPVDEEGAK